jgi:hypothetical protein
MATTIMLVFFIGLVVGLILGIEYGLEVSREEYHERRTNNASQKD